MREAPTAVPLHEGMQILELDKSGFYYYVTTKQIKSYSDTTPALYDYQDIMRVRDKRRQKTQKQKARSAAAQCQRPAAEYTAAQRSAEAQRASTQLQQCKA